MKKTKLTQVERLLKYLDDHKYITQIEALRELGILRLASRIHDIRSGGVPIYAEMVEVTNRFGEKCRVKRYSLEVEENSIEKFNKKYEKVAKKLAK